MDRRDLILWLIVSAAIFYAAGLEAVIVPIRSLSLLEMLGFAGLNAYSHLPMLLQR